MDNFNSNSYNQYNQEEETSLKLVDIWNLFWNHKGWFLICSVLCLLFAAVYIYRSPKIYSRTAHVVIDEGSQEAAMRDISSFTGNMARLRYRTNVDNEILAFASPDLLEEVSERLELQTSYFEKQFLRTVELHVNTPVKMVLAGENPMTGFSFVMTKTGCESFSLSSFKVGGDKTEGLEDIVVTGNLRDTIVTPAGRIVLVPTMNIENWDNKITFSWVNRKISAKKIAASMTVESYSKETSVVVLSINDRFPDRAEQIINTLIDVYNESWVENMNRSARATNAFINTRLSVIEKELMCIEKDLKNYKEKNQLADLRALNNAYISESGEYSAKSFQISNQISIVEFIKDYLRDPNYENSLIPANAGLTNSGIESQISKYNELILRKDNILKNSSESNPLVEDIKTSLSSLRFAILRSIENYLTSLNIEAAKLKEQEDLVLSKIAASSGQELELVSIERQRKVKESLYVYLLQKREENEITSLMNVANTRVIMNPSGSSAPVAPNSMMILAVALVLGLGGPFAFFFLKKVIFNTIESKDDIVDVLTMPYLAEIPYSGKTGIFDFLKKKPKDTDKRPMLVRSGQRDVINESFRVFRTNLDLMLPGEGVCKTVMMTSLFPSSGKTFVAINIASGMAIKGARTLLIDLDMRKAAMSHSFKVKTPGTAAYLNGSVSDIDSCISQISENLYIMGVGTLPPNPAELLLGKRFPQMLEELKKRFDYIFIDCPPVEVVADSSIISAHVDLTAFVVRAGLMDKRNLYVVEDIYKSGRYGRMAAVLNGVRYESSYSLGKYGYSRGYRYGYEYGSNKTK